MRGIHTCCPEPVLTVNVTENIVEMDGTRAFWAEKYMAGSTYNTLGTIALDYVPYARSQVTLMLNTAVMRQGVDFAVNNQSIQLLFTPENSDNIHVRYFALTDGTSSILADATLTPGMTVGSSSASDVPPSGWLFMDPTLPVATSGAHLKSAYPLLWTFLASNTDYLEPGSYADPSLTFKLKLINTPFYNGTTLVTGKTIIKT